jgi:hypothetical protein
MIRLARFGLFLPCWSFVACGGVATRDHSRSAGGSSGDGGSAGSAAMVADSGVGAASCGDEPEECLADCNQPYGPFEVCVGAKLQCREGLVLASQCPGRRCETGGDTCCDPATGEMSDPSCDAARTTLLCPSGRDLIGPNDTCVMKPEVCRVQSATDLGGHACSLGDPSCRFGSGCTSCTCTCDATDQGPKWECACVLC